MFDDLEFRSSLGSDNHSGVHPRVMEAIQAANQGHAHAYGLDEVCVLADKEFKRVFGDHVEAQYVFTGTAANVLALSGLVRSYEAVICSSLAHLHLDECAAPEKFWGAKLYTLPTENGKIHPEQCASLFERMGDQHFAQPRAVSLTQPTETGLCYTIKELKQWKEFCVQKNLMLHIDGARLANAAAHLKVSLKEITEVADVVSFGGTKNGLMGAEAVLLFSEDAKRGFKFYRKQAMQLSSKTRFLAAQFYAYLKNDLWREIAQQSLRLTKDLETKLQAFPEIEMAFPIESNALFVRLPKAWLKPFRQKFFCYVWDSKTQLCRWMISWDWTTELNDKVIETIKEVKNVD